MVQAVRDYTSSLDFDVNDPAELLTVQASPGCFRLGESHRINHRHPLHLYLPSLPAPAAGTAPAPALAPATLQATATGTNHYAMEPRVYERCYTQLCSFACSYRQSANRNNLAAVPGLFHKDTLKQVHKLGSHANLDMAHQLNDVDKGNDTQHL